MSSYHRLKREDAKESFKTKKMSIKIGNVTDSIESLKIMCNDKSVELLKSIELKNGEELEVEFWTKKIPEIIGVAKFTKDESDQISFSIDYSQSTL